MQSRIVSDYFINEFLVLNKNYSQDELLAQFSNFHTTVFGYSFKKQAYIFEACIHKSFSHELKIKIPNNEKLEFLGDSVLQLIISEELFERFKDFNEGQLSKLRSAIVNEKTLAKIARFYQVDKMILVGKGEYKSRGREKDSLISDTFEALLGAIYLDSNYLMAREVLLNLIEYYEVRTKDMIIDPAILLEFDAKSRLQELTMAQFNTTPKYTSVEIDNNDGFEITLNINDQKIETIKHNSKKIAMQLLAKKYLEMNTSIYNIK